MSPRAREIKLATADLVDELHGLEAAAGLIGRGKSHLHRCTSVNDAESFLNLADAAELERRSTAKPVTRALCRLAGGVFLPLPEDFGDGSALPLQVMQLAQELGDVSAAVRSALENGVIDKGEAAETEREIDQLIDAAVRARATVRRLQGKDPGAAVQVVAARGEG